MISSADVPVPLHLLRCHLCDETFLNSVSFVLHYAEHLAPGKCSICNQQLVVIQHELYHLQLTVACGKEKQQLAQSHYKPRIESAFETIPSNRRIRKAAGKQWRPTKGEKRNIASTNENVSTDAVSVDTTSMPTDELSAFDPTECMEIKIEADAEYSVTAHTAIEHDDPVILPAAPATKKGCYTPRPRPRAKPQRRDPRTYQCYICKRFINHLPNLKRHVANHYDRSLTCEQCGITCANWANMVHHKKTHSESKQYMCSYCGRGFHHRFNMMEHTFIHTRERRYKCDICGKMFGRRSGVDAHRLIHTGEKPHKCSIDGCDRAYMYSIDLKRHLFGAHGIYTKKHECTVCGRIFPENKLLVAHMKVH